MHERTQAHSLTELMWLLQHAPTLNSFAITFKVANHGAEIVAGDYAAGFTAREMLAKACSPQYRLAGDIRGTSFAEPETANIPTKSKLRLTRLSGIFGKKQKRHLSQASTSQKTTESNNTISQVIPKPNGFFHTISTAYNKHHILVLRPDDVWLAILVQFNFFVNANSELLRASFVAHEGSKTLTVKRSALADFGEFARAMVDEMEKNVVDPTLRKWALPDFSTTTERDTTVASITLMATLKSYFQYVFCSIDCGIPSVTLEGEKSDWEDLLRRAEKLKEYTIETIAWYHLLVPVLSRFVQSFEEPTADSTIDFWQKVAHFRRGGSGPSTYSGWLSAFCVFNEKGKWIGSSLTKNDFSAIKPPESLKAKDFWATYLEYPQFVTDHLHLDDTPYHLVDAANIPPCYAEVDALLVDLSTGEKKQAAMTAGVIATEVCSSSDSMEPASGFSGENDVVKPLVGWWLFNKLDKPAGPGTGEGLYGEEEW
ncbi:hypothetical protein MIND_00107600 [Mycena indigotica]|uniref:Uncharacterized protein n=1 Tax=Mycena indigotica TaxID=2126181 RepID=A0A8H6THN5_9AGAR|nr:uncharacterized protein MIND_00107600 [Mycena indigotica]KAF7315910.1 hypothetical protein MIND_00107600 [Mycena indigotica]